MKIRQVPVDKIIPYPGNPRKNADAVEAVAASIQEFGWRQPIVVDADMVVIVGHTRLLAARQLELDKVPITVAADLTPAQARAYRLADNRTGENAEWDNDLLAIELGELDGDFDLALTGFSPDELRALMNVGAGGNTGADETPEPPAIPVTSSGDIWLLEGHRLLCGDSTDADAVGLLMDGKTAQLLHADPPYGMGKEKDGVLNDNKYADKLDAFQMEWWQACRTFIDDNASAYIWGNAEDLWRLWYQGGLNNSERITFRNEITWDKREENPTMLVSGVPLKSRRMYHPTERCLFFMLGEQGFNINADNYWEGWEPIRKYLEGECKKCGWTVGDINRITGTQMAGHWITKSQWSLITEEHYLKIQSKAREHDAFKREHDAFKREHDELKREHDELKREHDELKREFYATRAYFDNVHDSMTDVWEFQRVTGDERCGHATPKPATMMARIMKSSLAPGDACLEPFGGSGSTLIGAEMTGRQCFIIELDERYCDVIVRRWQDFTGQTATRESDGATFDSLQQPESIAVAATA